MTTAPTAAGRPRRDTARLALYALVIAATIGCGAGCKHDAAGNTASAPVAAPTTSVQPGDAGLVPPRQSLRETPPDGPITRGERAIVVTVDESGAELVLADGAWLSIEAKTGRKPFVARLEIESDRRERRQLGPRYHVTLESAEDMHADLYLPYVKPRSWSTICNVAPYPALTARGERTWGDGGLASFLRFPTEEDPFTEPGGLVDHPRKTKGAKLVLDPGHGAPVSLDMHVALFDSHPC